MWLSVTIHFPVRARSAGAATSAVLLLFQTDPYARTDLITRVNDHPLALREPFPGGGETAGAALEIDGAQLGASVIDDIDAPIVAAAEQGAGRDDLDIVAGEHGDPGIGLVSVSE